MSKGAVMIYGSEVAAVAVAEAVIIKVPMMPGVEKASHVYPLLEYRRRVGEPGRRADNFTIAPDDVFGDPAYDPGHIEGRYINPPTQFVSEGVLVYLVNEDILGAVRSLMKRRHYYEEPESALCACFRGIDAVCRLSGLRYAWGECAVAGYGHSLSPWWWSDRIPDGGTVRSAEC